MTDVGAKLEASLLVAALADPARRAAAFAELAVRGASAGDAVRAGLRDGRWEVRRWCAYWLRRFAEPRDFDALVPLLRDPKSRVRHGALVALAHAPALAGRSEVVPLLLERACEDPSLRVRRQAVLLLAWERAHPDLAAFFQGLLERERDERLRCFARLGVGRSGGRAASC